MTLKWDCFIIIESIVTVDGKIFALRFPLQFNYNATLAQNIIPNEIKVSVLLKMST